MRLRPGLTEPGKKAVNTRKCDRGDVGESDCDWGQKRSEGMPGKPIEIDCEEVSRQISNYIDDELAPDLRAIMASHFKDCAHCSAVLEGTRNVVKLVGDGRAFEIPATTSKNLYGKLKTYQAERPRKRR